MSVVKTDRDRDKNNVQLIMRNMFNISNDFKYFFYVFFLLFFFRIHKLKNIKKYYLRRCLVSTPRRETMLIKLVTSKIDDERPSKKLCDRYENTLRCDENISSTFACRRPKLNFSHLFFAIIRDRIFEYFSVSDPSWDLTTVWIFAYRPLST